MIASSWSIVRHARARSDAVSPASAGGACAVAATGAVLDDAAQVRISVSPSGHGNGGSDGATSERSKAAARPTSAASSTTPG